MSVTVLFELPIKDDAVDMEEIVRATLAQTAEFPGNEGVEILIDDASPSQVLCVIRWHEMADFDAYVAWRHTPAGAHRLGELIASPPVTRRFSASLPL